MSQTPPTPPPKRPSIHLDFEDWLPYLAEENVPEAEKIALIETLWGIVLCFHDLQRNLGTPENTSGQSLDLTAALQAAVLNSQKTSKKESEEA